MRRENSTQLTEDSHINAQHQRRRKASSAACCCWAARIHSSLLRGGASP